MNIAVPRAIRLLRICAIILTAVLQPERIAHAVPAMDYAVTATIPVGDTPVGVAVDEGTGRLYVTNDVSGTLSIIDTDTNKVIKTTPPVLGNPYGVAVDPESHGVFVANFGAPYVSMFNGLTGSYFGKAMIGLAPIGVAVDEVTHLVYVTNQFPSVNSVSVVDPAGAVEINEINVGYRPTGIAIDQETHDVYVGNQDTTVSVIKGGTGAATTIDLYPTHNGCQYIAIDPVTHLVYVTCPGNNTIAVIEGTSVVDTIEIDGAAFLVGIAIDPVDGVIFVTDQHVSGKVHVLDRETHEVVDTVNVGSLPYAVTVDPTTHTAYVANTGSDSISVITTPIPPGPGTLGFARSSYSVPEGRRAVVTVRRYGDTQIESSVDYETTGGTAVAGADYVPRSGTLHFPPGVTRRRFRIRTIDNGAPDGGDVSVNVELSNAIGGSLRTPMTTTARIEKDVPAVLRNGSPPLTATVDQPYRYNFKATGSRPRVFEVAEGTLPPGLELNENGRLSGTPTTGGEYDFRIGVDNGIEPGSASAPFHMVVASAPMITAGTPPSTATVSTFYFYKFEASGVPAPTFSLHEGTLPPGLTLFANGSFGGTPTQAGVYTFKVRASNGASPDAVTPTLTITVS